MILPADLKPHPVLASGMMRLKTGYSGPALVLWKPSTAMQLPTFMFGADGKLPVAAIDTARGGEICRVIQRGEQMNNIHFIADTVFGPKFGDLTLGDHRCMWMEGDCQVENVGATGQVYGMVTPDIAALGIKPNDVTVMQVVQLHNGAPCNQLNAPSMLRYATFSMSGAGGGPHTRLFAEGVRAGDPEARTGGGYTAEDGVGYRGASVNAWLEISPVVLTYINGAAGTFFGQNQDFRSLPVHSISTVTAGQARIGHHETSISGAPNVNESAGMSEIATLVWAQAFTPRQAAAVASALYDLVPINWRQSHSNAPLVVTLTDSIWTGYKGDDLRGWDDRARLQLPSHIRWANFSVPGSPIVPHVPASPVFASNSLNLFPGWVAQAIRQHKGRVHCVWGAPTNDWGANPGLTVQQVYDQGTLRLIERVRGIDPSATITLCTATRTNQAIDAQMGAVSQLIRDGAAANNYGVVEVRNDPMMGVVNTQAEWEANHALPYKDGIHLSNAGWERMTTLLLPRIQAWLATLPP